MTPSKYTDQTSRIPFRRNSSHAKTHSHHGRQFAHCHKFLSMLVQEFSFRAAVSIISTIATSQLYCTTIVQCHIGSPKTENCPIPPTIHYAGLKPLTKWTPPQWHCGPSEDWTIASTLLYPHPNIKLACSPNDSEWSPHLQKDARCHRRKSTSSLQVVLTGNLHTMI